MASAQRTLFFTAFVAFSAASSSLRPASCAGPGLSQADKPSSSKAAKRYGVVWRVIFIVCPLCV